MERLCSAHVRASRLSSLSRAADCLAKAASTLSEAARAAAESFSSELLDITSAVSSLSEAAHGLGRNNLSYADEECTNPEDTDYYLSDDGGEERVVDTPIESMVGDAHNNVGEPYSGGPMTNDHLRFDPTRPPPVASLETEVDTVAGLAYRILVDHEADVLLFVCALIQNRRKVICYMNCSIPTFHMYKRFINDVVTVDVYTITKITMDEITEVGQKFLEADRSILLLPETVTPGIEVDEIDSWVIHVGWPSDEQRYEEQRLTHQAQNSVLVACSDDEELYPAGAAIMWQSQPWPGDVESFRASVALLRPIYEQKLALLPAEMKAKTYSDWISCHGPRGHRYVKSWDATTLVNRANSFLLNVLEYKPLGSEQPDLGLQNSLPEVSEGFMMHNVLEAAVKDGVLRVKIPDSGLNHASSLPMTTPETANEESPVAIWGEATIWEAVEPTVVDWEVELYTPSLRGSSSPEPGIFIPTPGFTYFTINEEFEAIPLMCFLANTCEPTLQRVVLFFDISGCQDQYRTLIERITGGWRVFAPENTEKRESNEDAASRFAECQRHAILLLPYKLNTPPAALQNVRLGYCVYWGSTLRGYAPLVQAKQHQAVLQCQSISIIMTTLQAEKITSNLINSDFTLHLNSVDLLRKNGSPWLAVSRTATRKTLRRHPKLIKELYDAHLRSLAKSSSSLAAEDIARRINRYTANVLLTGVRGDASQLFHMVDAGTIAPGDFHQSQTTLLSHATECLAQAAMALSEAAEAVAAVAKSLASDTSTVSASQTTEALGKDTEPSITIDQKLDPRPFPVHETLSTPSNHNDQAQNGPSENESVTPGEEPIPGADDEACPVAQSTPQGVQSIDHLGTPHQQSPNEILEIEATSQPPPSYRILLDDEADVFLAVCCLIRQARKVVCYVRSSITALDVYKMLLSVVEVPVLVLKASSPQAIERAVKAFQGENSSVLLLPATQPPSFSINETNLLVIHAGWPTDEQLYKQQINHHRAEMNVFVAYAGDKDIYPSSSSLLMHAQPCPHDELLFKQSCDTLRPIFIISLDWIPEKAKAKAYTDWIATHGTTGPYHPPSWSPSTTVRRANLYLLEVLKYKPSNSAQSGTQIILPAVSAGFVTEQKLESAVAEGVLRVKSTSGINRVSSLPPADTIAAGNAPLDQGMTSKNTLSLNLGSASTGHHGGPSAVFGSTIAPEKALGEASTSKLQPPRSVSRMSSTTDDGVNKPLDHVTEYLIIELDLDVIPSICHLVTQHDLRNAICFVKSLSTFEPLVGLLEKMIEKPVFSIRGNFALPANIQEAFNSPTGCLILCDMYSQLPNSLKDKPISLNIHLGWVDNMPIYRAQIQQKNSTVVLMRRELQAPNGPELVASLGRAGVSQANSSTKRRYNRQTADSTLAPGRKKWKELLSDNTSVPPIRLAYMAWITHHYLGPHKELGWTAIDVAKHANRYFQSLFRYGNDGNMFQGRPVVTQELVKDLGLKAAADAGLLTVKQ